MKAAFAKLMEKDPVQSSHIDFRAGGNNVPILTRASGSSTTGYQTMGLPNGTKPYPGGGANKTTLGAIRMGDQDGNGPASAIVGGPTDIFYPPGQPDREYPERTFANVGNNVFQPTNDDSATLALLRRLGDQKFKAESQAPFEEYRAQQRLAKDLEEASRNASLADLGTSREIIRNLAEKRRQQNEDDYLRKMLDAGATPEAARKEIEDVRNANAIQEAKKVDDREYQAKTLIQRIAASRGVTPMVREPLNQSSSIDNPQRSQAMSQAMGMPGEGFGTSPLDMNRQFMTPDFYKKFLRKSALSQESADEQTAFNNLITGADRQGPLSEPSAGAYSMATMRGQERQNQVEAASETLAARLETIRNRANRIYMPLLPAVVGKETLDKLYKDKNKTSGDNVLYSIETIQDMRPLQLVIALNRIPAIHKDGLTKIKSGIQQFNFGTPENPAMGLLNSIRLLLIYANNGEPNISIPFASSNSSVPLTSSKLVSILDDFKNLSPVEERQFATAFEMNKDFLPTETRLLKAPTEDTTIIRIVPDMTATQARAAVPIPGASGIVKLQALVRGRQQKAKYRMGKEISADIVSSLLDQTEYDTLDKLNKTQLITEAKAAKLDTTGTKAELLARLKAQFNAQ